MDSHEHGQPGFSEENNERVVALARRLSRASTAPTLTTQTFDLGALDNPFFGSKNPKLIPDSKHSIPRPKQFG